MIIGRKGFTKGRTEMITITVRSEDTLCGKCGQPKRQCRCFAAGQPRQRNRLQKIEDELVELARQHPEVLGADGFTSTVKDKRQWVLMSIRNRYYAALRELALVSG
jgi:hypothetical protein